MDLFDEEELVAQMRSGDFMVEPQANEEEEDLAHLREAEDRERKFKRVLQYPPEDDPALQVGAKRIRGEGDEAPRHSPNSSLLLADLPEDIENWDEFELPRNKRQKTGGEVAPHAPTGPILGDITNTLARGEREEPVPSRIHKRVPDGDFQSVTLATGERYYLSVKAKEDPPGSVLTHPELRFGEMCGIPYAELKAMAFVEQSKLQVPVEEQLLAELVATGAEEPDSGCESMDEEATKSLWVEKFKPKSYLQLLSDDGTNRILLKWLKLWDEVVFNRVKKVKPPKVTVPDEGQSKNPRFTPKSVNPEVNEELDEFKRPVQRVALLHGPPGLGKTTLAHVIACHAGYNVVEMNASDDRSLATFRSKLEAATQMQSVSAQDRRPNCLIIDEIDGSPAPTINHLVALITGKQGKKGSKKPEILRRPIICICNDLYVPALRPLKQHALVVPFPPTLSGRLSQRLLEISRKEKLITDSTALNALCEKTDNDIRSCLSTLQFFKSRGKPLRAVDVQQANVGQKDSQKSHFTVWNELFQIPRGNKRTVKRVRDELVQFEESRASIPVRYSNMLHLAYSCGDYDRLVQGVFENYLQVKFKDSQLENVQAGQDWFCFFDNSQQFINQTQIYAPMAYQPFTFVATHLLFGCLQKTWIQYPHTQSEKKNALTKTKNLISSMISEMSPSARAFTSTSTLVFDTLPIVLEILQPSLRPVNSQLYSPREKQELKNLVQTMIAYNLNYVQTLGPEGQYEYRLDPGVDEIAHFPGIKHQSNLTYALKQVISHEIQLEKMRKDEGENAPQSTSRPGRESRDCSATSTSDTNPRGAPKLGQRPTSVQGPSGSTNTTNGSDSPASTPNHLQRLKAKDIDVVEQNPVDFFGRKIVLKPGEIKKPDENNEIVSSDIWFKFKEGYNNAVRKNVKIKDLL